MSSSASDPLSTSNFNQFTSNHGATSDSSFLNSDSMVAKAAFLLVVIVVFVVLLRLGMTILGWALSPSSTTKLIRGMVDAKQMIVIPQNPNMTGSKTITRSVNASSGIEFTWSVWMFVDDLAYNAGQYRCVFYKGNDFAKATAGESSGTTKEETYGLNFPNNAPGVYLLPNTNALVVMLNTFHVINEEIRIDDLPLNKWVNLVIRCQNSTIDVFVNGSILKSHNLHGVVKQNYGDVYVAPNGGFSGYISNLFYFDYALGTGDIARLASQGPDTTMKSNSSLSMKNPSYLSLRWFFANM